MNGKRWQPWDEEHFSFPWRRRRQPGQLASKLFTWLRSPTYYYITSLRRRQSTSINFPSRWPRRRRRRRRRRWSSRPRAERAELGLAAEPAISLGHRVGDGLEASNDGRRQSRKSAATELSSPKNYLLHLPPTNFELRGVQEL